MNTNIKVDLLNKTITITKRFYRASQKPYSSEYHELLQLQRELPDYSIRLASVRRPTNRVPNPSYADMIQIIRLNGGEESEIQELHKMIELARATGSGYAYVRRWFLDRYPITADYCDMISDSYLVA